MANPDTEKRIAKSRRKDRVAEAFVYSSGLLVMAIILGIFFFLTRESRFAFQQSFPVGYRFALIAADAPQKLELSQVTGATFLAAHPDGMDDGDPQTPGVQPDDKENAFAPSLEELRASRSDTAQLLQEAESRLAELQREAAEGKDVTADLGIARLDVQTLEAETSYSGLFGTFTKVGAQGADAELFRDDWRAPRRAESGLNFEFWGFATPEYTRRRMVLAWEPDASYDPQLSPYRIVLRLKNAPKGIRVSPIEIDLKADPRGRIDLPTWVAATDADRLNGYHFEVALEPVTNSFFATLRNFFRTDWNPTGTYAEYGFLPLIFGTLAITLIAVLLATPLSLWLAVYLSEFAPARVREWLKPTIELLASVPTVVLAYFGLILLAPQLQRTVGEALGMTSARSLLTAAIIMGILIVPTIATVAEDSLRNIPNSLRDGAAALGLTTKESMRQVVLKAGRAGMIAAVLLGVARAFGETMVVWILSGGTPTLPGFTSFSDSAGVLVKSSRGIPDTIGIEMGNVEFEQPHYGHLFLLGLTLFLITLLINVVGYKVARRSTSQV